MVVEVKVDHNNCNDSKRCVETCFFRVLEGVEEQSIVTNPSKCSVCLEYMSSCPVNAISMKEK